jgi:hypothetical protein
MNQPPQMNPRPFIIALVLSLVFWLALARVACAEERKVFAVAVASFVVLGAVDATQTGSCLAAQTCREVGPLYRWSQSAPVVVTMKAAATTGMTLTLWKLHQRHPKLAWGIILGLTAAQVAVIRQNAKVRR